jgi:hypothetical protein
MAKYPKMNKNKAEIQMNMAKKIDLSARYVQNVLTASLGHPWLR